MSATASPRRGLLGVWDRLNGPGATRAENVLNATWALLAPAALVTFARTADLDWNAWQLGVTALLALDLAGGVSANASPAARRWWHRPGQGRRQPLAFLAAHVHPFVLAALFPGFGWTTAASMYAALLLAGTLILASPVAVRRPTAYVLFTITLLMTMYAWPTVPGLEWFAPVFYLKLLLAHLGGTSQEFHSDSLKVPLGRAE